MTYVIVKDEGAGARYYRQKDKDFTKDLMAASKWPTVSRTEEILAELSKAGAQELVIEETAKLEQQVKQEQVVKKDTELREYAHQLLAAKDQAFYAELERVSRKKRRYYKDRQQAVNYLLTKTNAGQVNTTSDKAQVALTKLGDL